MTVTKETGRRPLGEGSLEKNLPPSLLVSLLSHEDEYDNHQPSFDRQGNLVGCKEKAIIGWTDIDFDNPKRLNFEPKLWNISSGTDVEKLARF